MSRALRGGQGEQKWELGGDGRDGTSSHPSEAWREQKVNAVLESLAST